MADFDLRLAALSRVESGFLDSFCVAVPELDRACLLLERHLQAVAHNLPKVSQAVLPLLACFVRYNARLIDRSSAPDQFGGKEERRGSPSLCSASRGGSAFEFRGRFTYLGRSAAARCP